MPEGKDGAARLIACQDFVLPVTLVNLYLEQLRAIKNSFKGLRFIRGSSSSLRMLMKCEALESTRHLRNLQVEPVKFWQRGGTIFNFFFFFRIFPPENKIYAIVVIFVSIASTYTFQLCLLPPPPS